MVFNPQILIEDDQRLNKFCNTLFNRGALYINVKRCSNQSTFQSTLWLRQNPGEFQAQNKPPAHCLAQLSWNLTVAKIILSPLPCTLVSANIPSITIAAPRRVMGEKIRSDDNGEWRIYLKASHNRTFFFLVQTIRVLNPPFNRQACNINLSLVFGKFMLSLTKNYQTRRSP